MYTHGPKDMGLIYFTKREVKVLEEELKKIHDVDKAKQTVEL